MLRGRSLDDVFAVGLFMSFFAKDPPRTLIRVDEEGQVTERRLQQHERVRAEGEEIG